MSANWEVSRSHRECAVSGRKFVEGDEFYSALVETDESFERKDFSPEVWGEQNKDGFFSFWRTKLQSSSGKKDRKLHIDVEAFYTFFRNLEDTQKPNQMLFRYLIALMLVRKRVLRLDEIEKSSEGEFLLLYDTRQKEECSVTVCDAEEEELAAAQQELNQIFECDGIVE